jgi:ABC-type dipeptide/oligopeptide/nickel transport system permease subunit
VSTASATVGAEFLDEAPKTYWADVARRFRRNKVAVFCLLLVIGILVVSVAAPWIAPYGYDDQFIGGLKDGPSAEHWFGTDNLGRDMFSRIVYGARFSFQLAVLTVAVSVVIQLVIGGLAGWFGGWFDAVSMRLGDIIAAVPYVAMAFAAIAVLGRHLWVVMLVLVVRNYPSGARFVRSLVLQIRGQDYVEAARATGAGTPRVLFGHVLPNAAPQILATLGQSVGAAIINESAFSFLGVGVQEPIPSWGLLIANARGDFTSSAHLFWFPALAFVVTITALLFVSEALRDASDPRLRGA